MDMESDTIEDRRKRKLEGRYDGAKFKLKDLLLLYIRNAATISMI